MNRSARLIVVAGAIVLITAGIAFAAASMNFNSAMSGKQEAPVPRDTQARGNAVYMLSADGTRVEYMLMVANIENVFMAHIHMAPRGVAGPIVVWLYPGTTPNVTAPLGGGRIDGVIAEGSFGAGDLVGPLAGHPLSDLAYNCMSYHLPSSSGRGFGDVDFASLGIPTEQAYLEAYCRRTGRSGIPDWDFFIAFSLFRSVAIIVGVYRRALVRAQADRGGEGRRVRRRERRIHGKGRRRGS